MAYLKKDPVQVLRHLLKARGHDASWYSDDSAVVETIKGLVNGDLEYCGFYAERLGKVFGGTERFWYALGDFHKDDLPPLNHFICGLFDLSPMKDAILYKTCKVRKPIAEFDHNPLSLLWFPGTAALYLGNDLAAYEKDGEVVIEDINVIQWTGCALLNDTKVLTERKAEEGSLAETLMAYGVTECSYGAEGAMIKVVQQALFETGYIAQVDSDFYNDGVFGRKTAQALLRLQRNSGINETGTINAQTVNALVERLSKK